MTPREHIHKKRKDKFKLLPDGGLVEQNTLSGDLQRAIERLSEDLYSKQTHFILELIQNAEDNRYDKNAKPDLTFILAADDPTETPKAEGALLVINNELGFRPEHVKALCGVGGTTKKDKRHGYVGEKGIGFKSVFVVSSQPHIFSAGYKFRFQEEPDSEAELGYIIPYWISETPSSLKAYSGKTCIVLPLKPGKCEQVAEELQTIAPETILFLSKLRGLTVQIGNQKSIEVVRDDTKRPLVQFLMGDGYTEFWVNEETFSVPTDLREEKRMGIHSRKVSVALPLPAEEKFPRRVFAFLPTEANSGFPFLVNADFILSASRESIQLDRPWNLWLRDRIAPTFVKAFKSLLDNPRYRAMAYAHIPLLDDVQEEFFRPTVETIRNTLRDREVVWTFNGETFMTPSGVRLTSPQFRNLLTPSQMPSQLQKTPLVHPKIQCYREQLKSIGVRYLNNEEMIECMRDESWLASQDPEWFVGLYEHLSGLSWATQENLQDVNLLPTERGRLSNAATQPIYFPAEEINIDSCAQEDASGLLGITFLEPKIHELIKDDEELKAWLSDALGVRELTQANYCLDLVHVLNERRTEIGISKLVHLTAYIRDQYNGFDYNLIFAQNQGVSIRQCKGSAFLIVK